MTLLADIGNYIISALLLAMMIRTSYLAWILWHDWQREGKKSSRWMALFFVGIALAALRAAVYIPFASPPLWAIAWQVIAYSLIVAGLEGLYLESKRE